MEKNARAEMIAALVTDKYSGFKDGDETILEACSDTRLEEFRAGSDVRKTEATAQARLETDNRNISARLKVAEERLKTAESEMSEDEFLQRAPASIKTVVEEHKAAESALKASLVSQLKDLGSRSEEDLKKLPLEELKTLASYARVEVPNYAGRGIALERNPNEGGKSYAPPDPYGPGLKVLADATKH